MILNQIDNAMLGTGQVEAIYLGQDLVWESVDYATLPLTFKIISGGTINWLDIGGSLPKTIKYRVNGGEWTTIVSSDPGSTINVSPGDVVEFVGDNTAYGTASNSNLSTFSGSTAEFDVYGNIMSMVDSTDFQQETAFTETRVFQKFFEGTGVRNASKLVLPVTTLTDYCYQSMFNGCTSLTKAPALPATTISFCGYNGMFEGCTSLASAPALPATTLAYYCYATMFRGCASLTSVPALPATTLIEGCYSSMFMGCAGLTTAPELPATILVRSCYNQMFFGCSSLNYIKCLATDISANSCTYSWVTGVASAGTFVKDASADWSVKTGNNGIPSGWTVTSDGQLPDIPYYFNINAKEYDTTKNAFVPGIYNKYNTTYLVESDIDGGYNDNDGLFFNAGNPTSSTDFISVPLGSYINLKYSSTSDNPFNIENGKEMTFIIKQKTTDLTGSDGSYIGNRSDTTYDGHDVYGGYNYMIRQKDTYNTFHLFGEGYGDVSGASGDTKIISFTVQADNNDNVTIKGYNWTTNTSGQTSTGNYSSPSSRFGIFTGNYYGDEWGGDFYWLYIAPAVLTDAQIQEVIDFNEN